MDLICRHSLEHVYGIVCLPSVVRDDASLVCERHADHGAFRYLNVAISPVHKRRIAIGN